MELDRRVLMQQMALLLGATAIPVGADLFAAPAKGAKRYLPAASYKLLTSVADTIVPVTDTPGAVAAGVPAKLDFMLGKWASAKHQQSMVGALATIDGLAMTGMKKGFAALSPAVQKSLLVDHDKAALKPVPKPPGSNDPFMASFMGGDAAVVDPGYSKLKELIVAIYYNSKIAMTQELVYDHVPGGWTPSIKTTPQTRPSAGTGPF